MTDPTADICTSWHYALLSPVKYLSTVSIQTQSLALRSLRALHKRKPQETQALAFLAVFVYATHATYATQAIAFEWKPCFSACYEEEVAFLHADI